MKPSTDIIRGALLPREVLSKYGFAPANNREHRMVCPVCNSNSREPFCVDVRSGQWICHACAEHGDVFGLIAAFEGVDVRRDFPRILDIAAAIAGIDSSTDLAELERRTAERRRAEVEREQREREQRERAEGAAPGLWFSLPKCSATGRAYLAGRGLGDLSVVVRMQETSLAIPLFRDGVIFNVVSREPTAGTKAKGLLHCGTDGTFGRLDPTQDGPVVIVEGWADYLTARLIWCDRCILGAHGAGRLKYVAEIAAPLARDRGVAIVPHPDVVGVRDATVARDRLSDLGVERILRVETGDGDLNDWWMKNRTEGKR